MKIFLCHSGKDDQLTDRVYDWLNKTSFINEIWIDKIRLKSGDYLNKKISHEISSSRFLIPIITKNSKGSKWVKQEIKQALEEETRNNIKVIPILLKGCDIPRALKNKRYVSIDKNLNGIGELIGGLLNDYFVLKVKLTPKYFGLDEETFVKDLDRYLKSKETKCYVYVDTQLDKIIVEYMKRQLNLLIERFGDSFNEELQRFNLFKIQISLFLHNLSYLLSELIEKILSKRQGTFSITTLCHSINNLIQNTYFYLIGEISGIIHIFSKINTNSKIKDFFNKYIEYVNRPDQSYYMILLGKIYYPGTYLRTDEIFKIAFVGEKVRYEYAYLTRNQISSILLSGSKCHPSTEFTDNIWNSICLPQMLSWFLFESTFRDNLTIKKFGEERPVGYYMENFDYCTLG